mgnify:FL=1
MRKLINTFIIIFFFFICGNQESNSQEIEYINSSESKKNDYPFSEATVVNDIIYLSGQIGTLENGKLIDGGIKAETRQTMLNIKSVLEKNGSSLEKVFKCTCMLADIKDRGEMSIEYKKFFTKNMPARSAFAGSGLALNARVEIECWAVK